MKDNNLKLHETNQELVRNVTTMTQEMNASKLNNDPRNVEIEDDSSYHEDLVLKLVFTKTEIFSLIIEISQYSG